MTNLKYRKKGRKGYILVFDLESGKLTREHRVVVEKVLGRKLLKNEHVHHINGIKDDNRPENLVVVNARTHMQTEWKEGHNMDNSRKTIFKQWNKHIYYRHNIDNNDIIKEYKLGKRFTKIASKLGTTSDLVRNRLIKLGVHKPKKYHLSK